MGNPSDASYVQPLIDKVQQATARIATYSRPAIHSLTVDLALNDASLREALHQQGILTVGIPKTVDLLPPPSTPENVLRILDEAGLHRTRIPTQMHPTYVCGYSQRMVESIIASLLCRGTARLTYKGHRGANAQTAMAIMAHNAATLVHIHEHRLSKPARKVRQRLRLRCCHVSHFYASIN